MTFLHVADRHPTARAASFPNDKATIVHVLNRIAFGPRPGQIEQVRSTGLQAYIEQQLHPERIADSAVEARLQGLPTIQLSSRQIAMEYELPLLAARRQRQQAAAMKGASEAVGDPATPAARPTPDPVQRRANRVLVELSDQKILRAVYSERQLQEVLTDFWFNHFNVDARKGPERFMLTEYERDVIRPHVLGRFRDLLEATAKSPAMLFYLDNWMSVDPNGVHQTSAQAGPGFSGRGAFGRRRFLFAMPGAAAGSKAQRANMPRGLNENYGRELMELHTLGVDGGYTQKDVTEVARAFTGWTIQNPRLGGGFVFNPRLHDEGRKVVLGHVIDAGGERDGEQVLDLLAASPSTAHLIATELTRRFVSDTPPPALVDRVAARFRATDGDLRDVMRTILTSPEFLRPDAERAKVKTPFEFIVSALRTTGANVTNATPLVRTLMQLGMPLYMCQPPTGYKDTADTWVNTGALVDRMNVALQLASGRMPGVRLDAATLSRPGRTSTSLAPDEVVDAVLPGGVSAVTRSTIARATTPVQALALTLGSPEFQRR
jgi:uncharacterized protein (DUF1800 family)